MNNGEIFQLGILFLLVLLSAFFSGSEVALFSIDKKKLKSLFAENPSTLNKLTRLLEAPRRLLVTILIANNVVNVAASIIAVLLALDLAARFNISTSIALTVQIILLTGIIVLFGEITPKIFASKNSVRFARFAAFPLYWVNVIFYPIAETLTELIQSLSSRVKFNRLKSAITSEELPHLAELSHEKGTIEEDERELIHGIVSSSKISVKEIMCPRVDIKAVSIENTFNELLEAVKESGHSRIPVYKGDIDEINGILYTKDLLPYLKNVSEQKSFSLETIMRKPLFIPETKLINSLMRDFQNSKTHIAIVVDEFGGISGLITLEDILEEIVGEIRDELDTNEDMIKKLQPGNFVVKGSVAIDDVADILEIDFDDEGYETIGGFILSQAGDIPKQGYSFEYKGFLFSVKEILKRRVQSILIEKVE